MLTVRVQNIYVRVIQCDAARDVHTTVAHVQRSLAYVEWGLLRSMNRSSWMGKNWKTSPCLKTAAPLDPSMWSTPSNRSTPGAKRCKKCFITAKVCGFPSWKTRSHMKTLAFFGQFSNKIQVFLQIFLCFTIFTKTYSTFFLVDKCCFVRVPQTHKRIVTAFHCFGLHKNNVVLFPIYRTRT